MIRSCQFRRVVPLIASAALLGSSVCYPQELDVERSRSSPKEVPALEIIDKKFNEETGILSVVLRNRSHLAVTAFGISFVDTSPTGSKGTQSEDMYIRGGIAPGASYETEITLGDPSEPSSATFVARSVKLDHEIRSDNSSYGNTNNIDMWFELRAAHFVEYEAALTRLREVTSDLPRSVRPLLKEVTENGQAARRVLLDPNNGQHSRERARLSAIASVAGMTEQAERWIAIGRPEQEAVAFLEQFFQESLALLAKNVRPVDLERYER